MAISRDNIRLIGQLSTIGLSFVLAIVMGFGGGYLLDNWLGTSPWLTMLGFLAGVSAGIVNVYRVMQLANRSTRSTGSGNGSPPVGGGRSPRP